MEVLGTPPQKVLEQSKRVKQFFVDGLPKYCHVEKLADGSILLHGGRAGRGKVRGPPASRSLPEALASGNCTVEADPLFIDFLSRCLLWDPEARMTPSEALKHDWIRKKLGSPTLVNANSNDVLQEAKPLAGNATAPAGNSAERKVVAPLRKSMETQRPVRLQAAHS